MPYGNYGLTRNGYVDERFDPEKSTRAYARYMKYIYSELGDWYLSMAGYDWGTGNIQRAVEKTGYADFWELYKRNNLPAETKNYVPEILAAIIIANHPTQYGFDDITFDPPVLTDTVTINYSVDLRLVSDIVDAPVDELIALNPSLLRMVTPPDTAFDLHLPAGTATLFVQDKIAAIPESKRNAWRYHRVTAEDTLASVAHDLQRLRFSARLRQINWIQSRQARRPRGPRRPVGSIRGPIGAHRPTTPPAAATPWSPSPTDSASPSPSSAAGTIFPAPASRSTPAAASTWPNPPSSAPAAAAPRKKQNPAALAKSPALLRPPPKPRPVLTPPDRRHPRPMRATRLTPPSPIVERQAQRGFREAELAFEFVLVRTEIIITHFCSRLLIAFQSRLLLELLRMRR